MLNAPLGSKYTQPKSPHCTLTRPLEKIFLGSAEVDPTMLIGFSKVSISSSIARLQKTDKTLPESAMMDHSVIPAGFLSLVSLVAKVSIQLGHAISSSSSNSMTASGGAGAAAVRFFA